MRKFLLVFFFILGSYSGFATHTKGGWMYYEYLGKGVVDTNKLRYKIGLNFFMSCSPSSPTEDNYNFSIFNGAAPFNFITNASVHVGTDINYQNCTLHGCYPCIDVIPSICYRVRSYVTIVELAPNAAGYIISKQRCCRVGGINNIVSSLDVGETYSIQIPGFNNPIPNAHVNSSPKFVFNDTAVVCGGSTFSLNFSAMDPDGDSLHYYFCNALNGGNSSNPDPPTASNPPYTSVPYASPYSGVSPLGSGVIIDPISGTISGTAPGPGEYVVTVCVGEYRTGVLIGTTRKELHVRVADCTPVRATLDPEFTTCGDLTLSFFNQTDNIAIQNWFWTFGDPATGSQDTSYDQLPTHTFSQAGDYTIKLVVNRGLPCIDSTSQLLKVYPGFFPGFSSAPPYCVGQPVSFTDTTGTNYGIVNYWKWDFGVTSTAQDTSVLQNPVFSYNAAGTYTVQLISGNSKGCKDSITHNITVLPTPSVNIINPDTTICKLDSIPLTATGTGSFSWLPAVNIIGAGTATPTVFPSTPTKYFVTVTENGCKNRDSIMITALGDLSNSILASPTSICAEDTLTLTGSSNKTDHLRWEWSPTTSVQSPNAASTRAYPMVSTTYTLKTYWGDHCVVSQSINIPVTPLAIPEAGMGGFICHGQTTLSLNASGGSTYNWTPTTGLNDPHIANPTANPNSTTLYTVAIGVTGCARTKQDTVTVTVYNPPALSLPGDTLICSIDTLPIHAAGTGTVIWSPNYHINNLNTPNILVSPDTATTYHATLTDIHGCYTQDSVYVDVKLVVSLNAGSDTSICQTEGFNLGTISDALHYNWSPATGLNNDTLKHPFAKPLVTTTYTVIANIGKCESVDSVKIVVAPYPIAKANMDTAICIHYNGWLNATGGSLYSWDPVTYLSNPNIPNPLIIQPQQTTNYIVTVRDTLGCTRPSKDTVRVLVIPELNVVAVPADTSIVIGQPIRLVATGAEYYHWAPPYKLSSTEVQMPIASPEQEVTYVVIGTDRYGCKASDSVHLKVYNLPASIYVPTAFSPNGDGLNDIARPILLGMKGLNYFKVFNRWGIQVYQTSQLEEGWDGNFKGKAQDPGTFVWIAEGVTFDGTKISKKGYLVLIR